MSVRVSTIGVPLFRAHDVEIGERWVTITIHDGPKAIESIAKYHGRFVRVHPDDRDKLRDLGLSFVDEHEPLASTKKPKPAKPADTDTDGKNPNPHATKTGGKTDGKKE